MHHKSRIKNGIKERDELDQQINRLINDYLDLISSEGVCPLCSREIDKESKKQLEENVKKLWR